MLLAELSELTGKSVSLLIRAFVESGIEQLMDKEGNFILPKNARDQDQEC